MSEYYLMAQANAKIDSPKWAEVNLKCIKVAMELYDRAIRSLATIRKLLPSGYANKLTPTKAQSDALLKQTPLSASELHASGILPQPSSTPENVALHSPEAPTTVSPPDNVALPNAKSKEVKATPDYATEKSNSPTSKFKKPRRSRRSFDTGSNDNTSAAPVVSRPAEPQSSRENRVADGTLRHPDSAKSEMLA